ncbi:MAG: transcription antitermination factor NusB [Bacteroidales bacterium]|nr:transcription antitermination factor NusB [Bacteroidales bacterium]
MFSRRLLRIKVFQTLYAYHKVEDKTYAVTEKELLHSIHKSYELYHLLILLILDVIDYAASKIELSKQKKVPTETDLHPNTRFIDNQLAVQLRNNRDLLKYIEKHPVSWVQYPEIIKNLFFMLADTHLYTSYMEEPDPAYKSDKQFVERFFNEVVMNYEDLYLNLEEQSIYWIDDVDFVIRMIVKTLKKFTEDNPEGGRLLPMFKDKDDQDFARALLRKTIKNEGEYLEMIRASANNWELERIAFTDNLIMQLAISEAIDFPSIPTKVTINEFLEIAKLYSTHKSSQFINGILDNIFAGLKKEGRIKKSGRGLIGEV